MSIPLIQQYRIAKYIFQQKVMGNDRYPLVLMLEPLFQCNLACAGCGKIDHPADILRQRMPVADALHARSLALPLYIGMRSGELDRVAARLQEVLG